MGKLCYPRCYLCEFISSRILCLGHAKEMICFSSCVHVHNPPCVCTYITPRVYFGYSLNDVSLYMRTFTFACSAECQHTSERTLVSCHVISTNLINPSLSHCFVMGWHDGCISYVMTVIVGVWLWGWVCGCGIKYQNIM